MTGKGDLTNSGCDFKSQAAPTGTATYQIGNSQDHDFVFEGSFTDRDANRKTSIIKIGTCKMTHKGTGSFSAAAKVNGGELCLNSTGKEAMFGTGSLQVAKGATLSGKGVLGNSSVTVAAGGTLRSGITENNSQGNLQFSDKDVTVNGIMQTYVSSARLYSKFTGIGTLKLNGTLRVVVKDLDTPLASGTELTLIAAQQIVLGENLVLDLDPRYEWDTTRLAEGILVIKDVADGIAGITAPGQDKDGIYTLDGVKLQGQPDRSGIYVVGGVKKKY